MPDTPSLTFKAIQGYSDGTTVSWTEVAAPGSTADLEHPAPVLELAAASASAGGGSSDTGAIILSIVALVIAVAAAGYAFITRARARPAATQDDA